MSCLKHSTVTLVSVLPAPNMLTLDQFNFLKNKRPPVDKLLALWLVRSTLKQAVWVWALTGDVVFLGEMLYSHSASLHPEV